MFKFGEHALLTDIRSRISPYLFQISKTETSDVFFLLPLALNFVFSRRQQARSELIGGRFGLFLPEFSELLSEVINRSCISRKRVLVIMKWHLFFFRREVSSVIQLQLQQPCFPSSFSSGKRTEEARKRSTDKNISRQKEHAVTWYMSVISRDSWQKIKWRTRFQTALVVLMPGHSWTKWRMYCES